MNKLLFLLLLVLVISICTISINANYFRCPDRTCNPTSAPYSYFDSTCGCMDSVTAMCGIDGSCPLCDSLFIGEKCEYCIDGYGGPQCQCSGNDIYVTATNSCSDCGSVTPIPNCLIISPNTNHDGCECTKCAAGFQLNNGICESCPSGYGGDGCSICTRQCAYNGVVDANCECICNFPSFDVNGCNSCDPDASLDECNCLFSISCPSGGPASWNGTQCECSTCSPGFRANNDGCECINNPQLSSQICHGKGDWTEDCTCVCNIGYALPTCKECSDGYHMDASTYQCVPIPAPCTETSCSNHVKAILVAEECECIITETSECVDGYDLSIANGEWLCLGVCAGPCSNPNHTAYFDIAADDCACCLSDDIVSNTCTTPSGCPPCVPHEQIDQNDCTCHDVNCPSGSTVFPPNYGAVPNDEITCTCDRGVPTCGVDEKVEYYQFEPTDPNHCKCVSTLCSIRHQDCDNGTIFDKAKCICRTPIITFTTLPTEIEAGKSFDIGWTIDFKLASTDKILLYAIGGVFIQQGIIDDNEDDSSLFSTLGLRTIYTIPLTTIPLAGDVFSTTLTLPSYTRPGVGNTSILLVIQRNGVVLIQKESESKITIKPQCGCNVDLEICVPSTDKVDQCQCKPGYSRKDSNINNPCELLCNDECYINGECIAMKDKVGKVIGSRCKCKDVTQWGGENCSISLQQQCYEKDQLLCFGHGTTYNSKTNRCDDKCICDNINRWFGDNCNECYLTKSTTSLIQCDPIGTDNQLTNQICSTIIGQECICQPGYSGSLCQYRTIYGTLTFIRSLSLLDEEPKYIINYESLSPLQQLLKVNTTTQLFLQQLNLEYLSIEGKFILERDLLLSFPIDQQEYLTILVIGIQQNKVNDDEYNINVTFSITFNPNPNQLQSPPSPFSLLQTDPPPTLTTPPTINDIYDSWSSLQTTFTTPPSQQPQQQQPPIKSTEVSQEIGQPNGIEPVYDPKCDSDKCLNGQSPFSLQTEDEIKGNDNNNKTNVGMIIGIVIGIIVGVILLFVIVIISVRYCKKNEKCCFAKRSSTARSRSGLNNNTKANTNKSATTTSTTTTTTEMSQSTSNSDNNVTTTTNNDRSTKTSAVDLIEVMNHGEKLPDGWSKQQHTVTGEIFYVNNDKMISQRHSPIDGIGGDTAASQW